jgi:hypothetical protein
MSPLPISKWFLSFEGYFFWVVKWHVVCPKKGQCRPVPRVAGSANQFDSHGKRSNPAFKSPSERDLPGRLRPAGGVAGLMSACPHKSPSLPFHRPSSSPRPRPRPRPRPLAIVLVHRPRPSQPALTRIMTRSVARAGWSSVWLVRPESRPTCGWDFPACPDHSLAPA